MQVLSQENRLYSALNIQLRSTFKNASVFTALCTCLLNLNTEKIFEIYRQALSVKSGLDRIMNHGYCKRTKTQNTAVACALYEKPKIIFRFWIGLRSRLMRIQLKMCSLSLRENFKRNFWNCIHFKVVMLQRSNYLAVVTQQYAKNLIKNMSANS